MYLPDIPPDQPAEALTMALLSVTVLSVCWGTGPIASICQLLFAVGVLSWFAPRAAARSVRGAVVAVLLAVLVLVLLAVRCLQLGVRCAESVGRAVSRCRALLSPRTLLTHAAGRRRAHQRDTDLAGNVRPAIRRLPTYDLD